LGRINILGRGAVHKIATYPIDLCLTLPKQSSRQKPRPLKSKLNPQFSENRNYEEMSNSSSFFAPRMTINLVVKVHYGGL